MRRVVALSIFSSVGLLLAGCGGGGTDTSGVGAPVQQTFSGGGISATYSAPSAAHPLVAGFGSGPVFTGVAGVAFTSIATNQVPTLTNTKVYFSRNGDVWSMDQNGGNQTPLTKTTVNSPGSTLSVAPNGRTAVASLFDVSANRNQLFLVGLDGSFVQKLPTNNIPATSPSFSPSGATIAFEGFDTVTLHAQIYTINVNGTNLNQLTTLSVDSADPTFSSDGTLIYFSRESGNVVLPFQMAANGNSQTAFAGIAGSKIDFAVSPDNKVVLEANGTTLMAFDKTGSKQKTLITFPSGTTVSHPSYSPDGRFIVFVQTTATSTALTRTDFDGNNGVGLASNAVGVLASPCWGPFPQARNLIGSGGVMGASASGFLVGGTGDAVASFLAFTATTPSTASIALANGTSSSVFQIKADSITAISFINDIFAAPTVVVPANGVTRCNEALVSYNSVNGKVGFVVPFSPAPAKFASSKSGGSTTLRGDFLGVFDAAGKNLAPSGAHIVTFEAKTGKLLHCE